MKTALIIIGLLVTGILGYSQTLPNGFIISHATNITSNNGWNQPVGAVFDKIGTRLFVWEKAGKVYVCNRDVSGSYIRQSTPVLDISEEVANYNDFGLTGFALDPDFDANGLIYLSYVVDRHHLMNFPGPGYNPSVNEENAATIGRITRYASTMSGSNFIATTASREILLGKTKDSGVPILHLSHGTGSLVFAADGTLLASMGDGASFLGNDIGPDGNSYYVQALSDGIIRADENVGAFRSQMLTSLNGKLLRINPVNGDGISSNPFYDAGAPGSTRSKIWAIGLRNPFRISIKPGQGSTNPSEGHIGEVFIGDVGFGTWEELNISKEPGMNFGWPLYEGHNPETYVFINTENKEYPIPPEIPCGRRHMRFWELIRQDNAAKDDRIYDPCTSTLVFSGLHHIHARPVLDWIHANENYNPPNANARVGIFNAQGEAEVASIGSPASGVTGNVFNGNSSSGGIWYTGAGNNFPHEYQNTFFLADYGEKLIKRITIENTDRVTKVDDFATNIGSIVCMTENPVDGSLVYVTVGDGTPGSSAVKKITFGGNIPPVAKIKGHTNYSASNNLTVLFDGRESSDRDGNIVNYAWDFDDPTHGNNTSSNQNPDHAFYTDGPVHSPKKYTVKLTVTDNQGATNTDEFIVSINNTPPVVNITSPVKNSKYKVGTDTTYSLRATVNDAQHSNSQLTYEWQSILIHNNHSHPEPLDTNRLASTSIERIGCTGENYHWLIRLTVTDPAGLSATDTSEIYPNCSSTLPIFLHKFSVTQNGSANLVKWTTEIESHIEYFELERSADGISFSPINRQDARNTAGPNHYSFEDKYFLPGFNYYRLKIVEQGNVIRYSVVLKTVSDNEQSALRVVPNPVVGNFSLTYQSPEKDRVTIQIRDITGRLLYTKKEDVNKGQNVVYMQNLPNWNSGMYLISVQGRDEIKQTKFIKAR
jgi:glucose/arabinose dehydrogenase